MVSNTQGKSAADAWIYLTPLAAAPALPLARIFLAKKPPQYRLPVYGTLVLGFLAHGAYLINRSMTPSETHQDQDLTVSSISKF